MNILKLGCLFCFIFFIPNTLFADGSPEIMLINSDTSVDKYRVAQEEFGNSLADKTAPHMIADINLGDKKWELAEVEEFLYDENPDLIYCVGTKAYLVANRYMPRKSIIFSSIVNWLRLPVTRKTYGVSNELYSGMQIMLFRYIFPDVQKIGLLYSKKYTEEWFEKTRTDAKDMGVEVMGQRVFKDRDIVPALNGLLSDINAFWLISDPEVTSEKADLLKILEQCDTKKIPVFSYHEAFVKFGAVLIVSADNRTIGRQAASIATEIVGGGKFDEKVQFPAGSHITLNLRKIKAYDLQYNQDALDSVNVIIE